MYDAVLVATDGSDDATAAEDLGLTLAKHHDAAVHAVYVIETRTGYDNAIVEPSTVREQLRAHGTETLRNLTDRAESQGCPVTAAILEGVPHEELLSYISEHDIAIVVLGVRGRSSFKRILLGSVSEALIDESPVPVVVVRA